MKANEIAWLVALSAMNGAVKRPYGTPNPINGHSSATAASLRAASRAVRVSASSVGAAVGHASGRPVHRALLMEGRDSLTRPR